MVEIEVDAKRWGNSIGIRIPSEVVEAEGIEPDDAVLVDVRKLDKPADDAFGFLADWDADAQRIKDELRAEHDR